MTSLEPHDDVLFARAGCGDRAAFTLLVRRHSGRLLSLAFRVIGERTAAEDIVQETFIRAWRAAPQFDPRGRAASSAGAWLARVAVNLAIDHLRRPRSAPLDAAPEPLDPSPSGEARLIGREREAKVRDAVLGLPPRQRAALALVYDEGFSNIDGARLLGVSVGAFELLLVRARRTLRGALAADADPRGAP